MKRIFKIHQDIKVSIWQRQHFEIEAENEEEAKKLAMVYKNMDVSSDMMTVDTETLYETEEFILPEENDGQETIQLYFQGEEQPFATNVDNNP